MPLPTTLLHPQSNRPMRSSILLLILLSISLTSPNAPPPAPPWVQVTPRAEWQPRDSQGEVVFGDRLWIFGGWFNSFAAPPRDVWSSPDGKTWTLVTQNAPWKHSDLPM